VGYDIQCPDAPAIEYSTAVINSSSAGGYPYVWSDSTGDTLATARQLTLRVVIAAANTLNATNIQTIPATQENQVVVYNAQLLYLGFALLLTLLSTSNMIPIYLCWGRLGCTVTLSPIENAKAFDADQLACVDSDAPVKSLLKAVGGRPVRYGAMSLGRSWNMTRPVRYGTISLVQSSEYDSTWSHAPEKLVMSYPRFVHEPVDGRVFVGWLFALLGHFCVLIAKASKDSFRW
jgi:hypothetical protein